MAYRGIHAAGERADWPAVVRQAEDALHRFAGSDSEWLARIRVEEGHAFVSMGDWRNAAAALTPALPPRLQKTDVEAERLRLLAAVTAYSTPDRPKEREFLARALTIAHPKYPRVEADVLLTRGNIFVLDDPAGAVRDIRRAHSIALRLHDRAAEAKAGASLCYAYANMTRFDEAVAVGEAALRLERELKLTSLIQRTEGNLGWAWSYLGDYEAAEQYFADANTLAAAEHALPSQVKWQLQLGNMRLQRHDLEGAVAFYRSALDLARQAKDAKSEGFALANLAVTALEKFDIDTASRYNTEALAVKKRIGDVAGQQRSTIIDARIALDRRDFAKAESTLNAVLAEATDKSIRWDAHARLAEVYVASGKSAAAGEQFRAALDEADNARQKIDDPERRLSFLSGVTQFYTSYIDFLVARGHAAEALQVADLARARTLAEGVGVTAQRVDPQRAARDAGVVVLSYWLDPEKSWAWVVTPQSIEVWPLPAEAKIAAEVDAYQKEIDGSRGTAASARGMALYRMLVEPAARRIPPGARVAVIPDGRLHAFNFETLVVPSPQPHYWIEDAMVEVAPSLQFLGHATAAKTGGSLLLVGNPPQVEPGLPPLQYAPAEMQRVAHHFHDVHVLDGAKATPRQYETSSPERFAYVHFVAHAVATRQRPLDSAVILGRDASGYKLYARDVIAHPLHARLVTVSSCVGAGRRAYEGEGLVGLAWAFLRAGAHQVIAALWEVNDAATPQLMDAMYGSIRAGNDPAVALRAAKLKLIRSGGVSRKPLYWAPFVLYSGS
jgi:CHAT domain-containing protein/tetratricopeptide (TPR) repeat protein